MKVRNKMIVGNWKLFKTVDESVDFVTRLAEVSIPINLDVLICPTFLALYPVVQQLKNSAVKVGAQNIFWEDQGAYTGEVSGPLIKAVGVEYVIVGHSERRFYFGEIEKTIVWRLAAAWRANLIPILCIGELMKELEAGQMEGVLESQLAGALAGATVNQVKKLIVAYEPIWAINTGKIASDVQVNRVHNYIRSWLEDRFNRDVARSLKILYGGSVNLDSVVNFLRQDEIDGVLIGGASLDASNFIDIINVIKMRNVA